MKNKSSNHGFDWNVTGGSICNLGIESICYFLLALGLELLPSNKLTLATLKEWWKSIKIIQHDTPSYLEPLLKCSSEAVALDLDEDIDVKAERTRVLSGSIDSAILYLRNLSKVYPGEKHHIPKYVNLVLYVCGFPNENSQRVRKLAMARSRFTITSLTAHFTKIVVGDFRGGILFYAYHEDSKKVHQLYFDPCQRLKRY